MAETVSLTLQGKDITMQDALDAVETAKVYYKRLCSDKEVNRFYDRTVAMAEKHTIEQAQLPRYIYGSQYGIHSNSKGLLSPALLRST